MTGIQEAGSANVQNVWESRAVATATFNFLRFLILACQKKSLKLFNKLTVRCLNVSMFALIFPNQYEYEEIIQRDPLFGDYVEKIGEIFCNHPPRVKMGKSSCGSTFD
eukprot:754649-Hanusia_phi.AAC.2